MKKSHTELEFYEQDTFYNTTNDISSLAVQIDQMYKNSNLTNNRSIHFNAKSLLRKGSEKNVFLGSNIKRTTKT